MTQKELERLIDIVRNTCTLYNQQTYPEVRELMRARLYGMIDVLEPLGITIRTTSPLTSLATDIDELVVYYNDNKTILIIERRQDGNETPRA